MSSSSKSLRLNFKGEKPAKKKKSSSKKRKIQEGEDLDNSSDVEDVGGDEQAWVPAYSAIDVAGPTFFFQRSRDSQETNSASICLSLNPTSQQVVPSIITKSEPIDIKHLPSTLEIDPDLLDGAQLEQQDVDSSNSEANQFIPQSVHQVWVANRVSDSQVWTLRSAESKFLSADKHGIVTALSEARGPQEGWELIPLPPDVRDEGPVVALKSAHGTLLGTDEIAGGKKVVRADVAFPNSSSSGNGVGDGDGESSDLISKIPDIGASERWEVRVQWKHRHAAREKARGRDNKKQKGDGRERAAEKMSEDQLSKSRQAWGAGRTGPIGSAPVKTTKADRKALEKAEKEGRLAEEMLDRRAKKKSDKFAK